MKLKKVGINGIRKITENIVEKNGCCAICGKPETSKYQSGNVRLLCVDHNHRTSKIRGLLCSKCNSILGYASDSIETLANSIKYLTKYLS